MIAHIATRLAQVASPVVVVAGPGQALPALPPSTCVARDAIAGGGPLEGIAAGLAVIGAETRAVFVTTTDAPFVHPIFVRRLWALREAAKGSPWDAVVARVGGRVQPLCALYATSVHGVVATLLGEDRRRASLLAEQVRALYADEALLLADPALRAADGGLLSLRSVNTPAEYEAALADAARSHLD